MYTEPGEGRVHVATWKPYDGDPVRVYVDENPVSKDETMVFDGKGQMEYVPIRRKNQRCCFYVSGNSGSGKSTWIANCLKKLMRMSPNKERWLFSSIVDYDPVYMDRSGNQILKKVDYSSVPLADWMRKCCPPNDVDLDRVRRGRAYSSRRRALLARPIHIEERGVGKLRDDRHARRTFR